jgi:hypothetical protein
LPKGSGVRLRGERRVIGKGRSEGKRFRYSSPRAGRVGPESETIKVKFIAWRVWNLDVIYVLLMAR